MGKQITSKNFCFHFIRLFVLPEEMELMQEVEQAVEYGQLPQPVDLKW
jgi:hypothetical protein